MLLPDPTFMEKLGAVFQGAWSVIFDRDSRAAYEEAVKAKVIKDVVLHQSNIGSLLTYQLFSNLQNPLLKTLDFKAFLQGPSAVGPALENFHDTLAILRAQLPADTDSLNQQTKNLEQTINQSEKEVTHHGNLNLAFLGSNQWQNKASEDPKGLEAYLFRMATPMFLEASYYSEISELLIQHLAKLDDPNPIITKYVPGSCRVGEVALLNARAMEMKDFHLVHKQKGEKQEVVDEENDTKEEDASLDTDGKNELVSVAAQIDVLYEVTHTFEEHHELKNTAAKAYSTDTGDTLLEGKTAEGDESLKATMKAEASANTNAEAGIISSTNLLVATFEGWLQGGPDESKGLRWKIALLREALEFPQHQANITRSQQ